MMFLDCPAYLDEEGAARCGLPAEVRCQFTMHSTSGPLESAMIRCPAGHWFSGPMESLTGDRGRKRAPGPAGPPPVPAASAGPVNRSDPGKDTCDRRDTNDPAHIPYSERPRSRA